MTHGVGNNRWVPQVSLLRPGIRATDSRWKPYPIPRVLANFCDRATRRHLSSFVMLVRPRLPRLIPRPLLALCWVMSAAFATLVATGHETDLSGIYEGHAPASDAA